MGRPATAPCDSVTDRQVVLDEVELRLLPSREVHLVRIGHADGVLADLELDGGASRSGHPGTVPT